MPYSGAFWHLQVLSSGAGHVFVIAKQASAWHRMYTISAVNGEWGEWRQVCLAESPTKTPLTLINGFESAGTAIYSKDLLGNVILSFYIHKSDQSSLSVLPYTIATMPEGFRPATEIHFAGTSQNPDAQSFGSNTVNINSVGSVIVHNQFNGAKILMGSVVYSV